MRLLLKLYETVLNFAKHPKAPGYLAGVSFVDASVFPVSPLFMMIPMAYAKPERAFWFASITIVASVLGGILGYFLGIFAFQIFILQFFEFMGYMEGYQRVLNWFQNWGYWAIILGCITPFIPYKIFTIGAGVLQMNLFGFLLASSLGRSLRFYIISSIIYWGGPKMEPWVKRTLARL